MHSPAIRNILVITLVTFVKIDIMTPRQVNGHESLNKTNSSSTVELSIDKDQTAACLNTNYYLNRHQFKFNHEMNYAEKTGENSYNRGRCISTGCQLKKYAVDDVVRCFDSLSIKRQRQPMHIAFIGDSTIRQHFVSFLRVSFSIILKNKRKYLFTLTLI